MSDYQRKTTGIRLLRTLVCRRGRTRLKGDAAGVHLTIGEIKEVLREYDELFDHRNKMLKDAGLKPYLKTPSTNSEPL